MSRQQRNRIDLPQPEWGMRAWADTNQWDLVVGSVILILMGLGFWKALELVAWFTMWVLR